MILKWMGLHPGLPQNKLDLTGKNALIITTSQAVLLPTKANTGVYASELTHAYYEFLDCGMTVDLASIKGGEIPIEPFSLRWPLCTFDDKRMKKDKVFLDKIRHSLPIEDLKPERYDLVYIAGGWGASYDMPASETLGELISNFYSSNKPIGAVCHGPLGLLKAKKSDGTALVKGLKLTAVTNKQLKELFAKKTPVHPETALISAGAIYQSKKGVFDVLQNHIETSGKIVTGQNQNDSAKVARTLIEMSYSG
jgi:putative intracellular protease/amidase